MPFLRVIRDKRGYETTYLMHWYREGHRQRSRILYVFRTPGGVRVGRNALDPDVLREIEGRYPDIQFDWRVVRDNQQVVEAAPGLRRRRDRRQDPTESDAAPVAEEVADPAADRDPPPPSALPPIPSLIEGQTPAEQMAFLAEWYPAIRERAAQSTSDPARHENLRMLAERLNPAGWIDADQITMGLQQAAEALERLSHGLVRRRRSRRRDPRASVSGPPTVES